MVTAPLTTGMESSITIEVRFGDPVSFEVGIVNVIFKCNPDKYAEKEKNGVGRVWVVGDLLISNRY